MARLNVWPWVRPFLILVLTISVPWILYWFGYVNNRVTSERLQAYATLSAVTENLNQRLSGYEHVTENVETVGMTPNGTKSTQEPTKVNPKKDGSAEPDTAASLVTDYLSSILKVKLNPPSALGNLTGQRRIEVNTERGGLLLNVAASSNGAERAWQYEIPLETIVPWDVVETEFDGLVVLGRGQELVAEDRRLPPQSLGTLVPIKANKDTAAYAALSNELDPQSPGQLKIADQATNKDKPGSTTGQTAKGGPLPLNSLFDFPEEATVTIGGVEYVAFLQVVNIPSSAVGKPSATVGGGPAVSSDSDSSAPVSLTSSAPNAARPGAAKSTTDNSSTLVSKIPVERVLVCGLIARSRLKANAIRLSNQALVTVGTLVALGLFAIPFLKLRFIGERERMRRSDVWLLSFSILSMTLLLTLVVRDIQSLDTLKERFDGGLRQFSDEVLRHIGTENSAAGAQIVESVRDLLSTGRRMEPPKTCAPQTQPPQFPDLRRGAILAGPVKLHFYHNFEALIDTDVCGNQVRKWMVRTLPTSNINISNETFFSGALAATEHSNSNVSDQMIDPLVQDQIMPYSPQDWVFGVSIAPTTDLQLGVYGVPVNAANADVGRHVPVADRTGVVANATTVLSLTSTVTAKPYEFVLVDQHGAVVFQSMQGSFRGERFFDAIKGGTALQQAAHAAIHPQRPDIDTCLEHAARRLNLTAGRSSAGQPSAPAVNIAECADIQSYTYHGKQYRMLSVEIPQLGLTLITSYDQRASASLAARTFGTTAVFSLCMIILLLLAAGLSGALFGSRAFDFAWPSMTRVRYYQVGILLLSILVVLMIILRALMSSGHLRWTLLLTPALITLGLGVIGKTMHRRRLSMGAVRSDNIEKMAITYTAFAVSVLMAVITVPVWLEYSDAFYLHARQFEQETFEQWSIAKGTWDDSNEKLFVRLPKVPASVDCIAPNKRAVTVPCAAPELIYASADQYDALLQQRAALSVYHSCANLTDANGRCLAEWRPRVPYSMTAPIARWLSRFGDLADEDFRTLKHYIDAQDAPQIPTRWPDFDEVLVPLFGLVVLAVALWLLVQSIARHVLGIALTDPPLIDETAVVIPKDGNSWLMLRPTQKKMSSLKKSAQYRDLQHAERPPAFPLPQAGQTLILEHVETKLADAEWRAALLAVISSSFDGCLILASEIDPLYYITQRVREKSDYLQSLPIDSKDKRAAVEAACSALRIESASWAMALRTVRKVRGAPPLFKVRGFATKNRRLQLRIRDECGCAEFLQDIGRQLLSRQNLAKFRWNDIVNFVLDAAEPNYRSIWELCSREERLVLIQLAQNGLVNPKREDTIWRLGRRGLVRLEPRFRLMNESFQRFVAAAESHERVAEWEYTNSKIGWARLGTPLYALAAMVIAVLLFAEQGAVSEILAVSTTGIATLGSFRNIYATLTRSAGAPAKVA